LEEAGAPPQIETIQVGRLRWISDHRDVTVQPLGELISMYAERENRELTLLRLTLSGVLDPEKHLRIDTVLREIVCNRYCSGSSLLADEVLIEPRPEQLGRIVGDGVLLRVLERLQGEAQSTDLAAKRIADHALKLLYRLAWEEQSE
jgi:hypothetical protein